MSRTRDELETAAARVIADGPVPLRRLARLIPCERGREARTATSGALVRWITRGKRGVYLDGARLAGKGWCSSTAALARFSAAVAALELGEMITVAGPTERDRRTRAADAELERLRTGR